MRIAHCISVAGDLKRIGKKQREAHAAVEQFERMSLRGVIGKRDRYSGLHIYRGDQPAAIYKCRVRLERRGASDGLRYVYEEVQVGDDSWWICLAVEIHPYDESSLESTIRARYGGFDLDRVTDFEVFHSRNPATYD